MKYYKVDVKKIAYSSVYVKIKDDQDIHDFLDEIYEESSEKKEEIDDLKPYPEQIDEEELPSDHLDFSKEEDEE